MFTRLGLFDGRPESRRAALLDFCSDTLGVAREKLAVAHDPLGAPLLLVDGQRGAWSVSSSSRENVFLFGLARGMRIGVDVEIVQEIATPWNVLHPDESAAIAALPPARRTEAFFKVWTGKEAYLKALGVGLRREPATISIGDDAGRPRICDRGRAVTPVHASFWREGCASCAVLGLPI